LRDGELTSSSFDVADWHAATPSCLPVHNTGWRSTGLLGQMPTPDTEPKYHSHTQWKCRLWWRPACKRDNADRRSEPVLRRWPPSFRSRGLSRSVRAFEPSLGQPTLWSTTQHERYQRFDLAPAASSTSYVSRLNRFKREEATFFTDSAANGRIL
jgi:hypothetical protein